MLKQFNKIYKSIIKDWNLFPMAIKYDLIEVDQNTLNTRLTVGEKGEMILNLINKLDSSITDIYGIFINGIFKPKTDFKFEKDILAIKEFYGLNGKFILTNDYINDGVIPCPSNCNSHSPYRIPSCANKVIEPPCSCENNQECTVDCSSEIIACECNTVIPEIKIEDLSKNQIVMYDDILEEYKYNSPLVLLVGKKDSGNYLVTYKIVDNIINTDDNQIVFEDEHPELTNSIAVIVNGVLYRVGSAVEIVNNKTIRFRDYFPSQFDDVRLIRIKNT